MSQQDKSRVRQVALQCRGVCNGILHRVESGQTVQISSRDLGVARELSERFNQWSSNSNALTPPSRQSSLVQHLHELPQIEASLYRILSNLLLNLQFVDDIASGRRLGIGSTNAVVTEAQQPNLDPLCEDELNLEDISASTDSIQLSEDSSSELHGLETEMTSFLRAASKRIDNLFTMTHLLFTYRRSLGAAYTALEEGEDSSTPPYELEFDPRPDILHIAQKFPLLRQKDPQLIQRLGRANARRRLWLKVKRDHDKLLEQSNTAANHDMPIEHDYRFSESDPSEPNKSFSTPRTRSEGLTVSSNASASGDVIVAPFVPTLGVIVEAAPSQRTYATAVASSEGIDELFPGLPEEADNGTSPFICPYCFETQQPGMSEEQWRQHIVRDIKPYICTFPECGIDAFETQRSWFEHELLQHRFTWVCPNCSASYASADDLKLHLTHTHNVDASKYHYSDCLNLCRISALEFRQDECPFCEETWASSDEPDATKSTSLEVVVNRSQFRDHVGAHLQKIAAFALPRAYSSEPNSTKPESPRSHEPSSTKSDSRTMAVKIASRQAACDYMDDYMQEKIEFGPHPQLFLSKLAFDTVTSKDVISAIVTSDDSLHIQAQEEEEFANRVYQCGRSIFATCVYCDLPMIYVKALLDIGITDATLPLSKALPEQLSLKRGFKTSFIPNQKRFRTAYFAMDAFQSLDDATSIPIHYSEVGPSMSWLCNGSFGDLWEIKIHPEHYGFTSVANGQNQFIMKIVGDLYEGREKNYHREMEMVGLDHPHLAKCLTSFTFKHRYYRIYELANCDLEAFMQDNSEPNLIPGLTELAFARQLYGLAAALRLVHDKGESQTSGPATLDVPREINRKLSHALDIKPANILVYVYNKNINWLRLPDFIWAKMAAKLGIIDGVYDNRKSFKTRSSSNPPIYRAPERLFAQETLSTCDLWSLGCVYLELLVWYVEGLAGLEAFRESRVAPTMPNGAEYEGFFYITGSDTHLRQPVIDKMDEMQRQCNGELRAIASVIPKLLQVEPKSRLTAAQLVNSLQHLHDDFDPSPKKHLVVEPAPPFFTSESNSD